MEMKFALSVMQTSRRLSMCCKSSARTRTNLVLARGRSDVVNARPSLIILLAHAVKPDEVFLRVGCHLSGRSRDDEVSADTSPISLAELVQTEKEQFVLFFSPRNAFATLLFATLGGSFGLFRRRRLHGRRRRHWRRSRRLERFRRRKAETHFRGDVMITVIVVLWKLYETSFDVSHVFFQLAESILQVVDALLRHLFLKLAPVIIARDGPRPIVLRQTRLKEFVLLKRPAHRVAPEQPEVSVRETGVAAVAKIQRRHVRRLS